MTGPERPIPLRWPAAGAGLDEARDDVELIALLREAVDRGASDVHLRVGSVPALRIDGRLVRVDAFPLADEELVRIANVIMPVSSAREFADTNEADFAYEPDGVGRFRVNVFRQQGTVAMVLRHVSPVLPTIEELGLPPVVRRVADEPRGLVLVTGRIGMGKSTTLAAMIDQINQTRDGHILTIEDPVEYRHRDQRCIVTQREIGADTDEFRAALKRVLRQDPDVILIGEMRDADTMWAAMSAAETGQLVLSTLHTVNAMESVNRILDFFPAHQHAQVRAALASTLRGIISQRLLPRADGRGRVPAVEVMVGTGRVAERIADPDRTKELEEVIADGSFYGMQTFDQSLLALYERGAINRRDALSAATHPHDLRLALDHLDGQRDLAGDVASPASVLASPSTHG
jgi:twitching motility protein PilT